ncbi:UNVERIFIED_CONTAM: protein ANTI-SILENCING 1 [Sesamum calycinum]|uniref:Protein ANTI-SILENCING 1 n=1 Tax=Sesamum calycinum TaxID=2727403 RepID=A0AAW2M0D7_9LAMI
MSPSLEAETLEEPEFKWGKKRGIGGRKSDVQFYESFTYDGLDYSLYDCVYMHKQGEREPYVGKLVKIWENADKSKKIKVQWFFRPSEITYYLRDAEVLENELFFASGDGNGLANINPLSVHILKDEILFSGVLCKLGFGETIKDSVNNTFSEIGQFYRFQALYEIYPRSRSSSSDNGDVITIIFSIYESFGRINVEAIAGKCNVVCISTDSRNRQPSAEELRMADYVFYRIFDVKTCTISDQMDDTVGGLKVQFVFNRAESVGTLDVPTLVLNSKDEARNVIACKETPKLLGNNSTQQPNNLKWHENGNPMVEKEGTDLEQVQVKLESLLGDYPAGVDVNAKKDRETTDPIESTSILGAENVGCRVSTEKNKVKDKKIPINEVEVEKRMGSARSPGNLDDTPLKRVKLDGPSSPSKGKDSNAVQSLIIPGEDAAHLVIDATSSEAKLKSELVKNSVGSGEDVKLAENSTFLDEKLSKTSFSLSKENPRSGHTEDAVGLERDTKLPRGLKAKEEKPSKINAISIGKSESAHGKDSVGTEKDKRLRENTSACRERPSTANVVSPNETARLSTSDVPHEAPKSGSNKDHEGSGQSAKLVKSSSASFKRPLDTSTRLSKEKSNRRDACHENKDAILDNDSCSMEGRRPKKGKYDDSLKISKDNNNNSSVKFKERTSLGETKNSLKLAISHDKKEKSRLGAGSSNDKVGKLSNDNLPNLLITTTDGGGKNVEGRIFEVTRRPIAVSLNLKHFYVPLRHYLDFIVCQAMEI